MRWCAAAWCVLAGFYRPASLDCAVTCADGAPCPSGLTCGATDRLCHAGPVECSAGMLPGDAAPGDAAPASDGARAFCDPDQPGLVGCYEFEGNAADAPRLPAPAITVTGVTFPTDGEVGSAAQFDGDASTSGFIVQHPTMELAAFTIELWVNPMLTPANSTSIVNHILEYGLTLDAGVPVCTYYAVQGMASETVTAVAPDPVLTSHWTHLACTYDGATLATYVNGVAAARTVTGDPIATNRASGIHVGGDPGDAGDIYTGRLDELRIFNLARTEQQICADAGPACP